MKTRKDLNMDAVLSQSNVDGQFKISNHEEMNSQFGLCNLKISSKLTLAPFLFSEQELACILANRTQQVDTNRCQFRIGKLTKSVHVWLQPNFMTNLKEISHFDYVLV